MGKLIIGRSSKKILIIDDDTDILDVVGMILMNKGFDVYRCQVGLNVSDLVASYVPDLILLDVLLPGISGIEICKDLKKHINTPIILFTALPKEKVLLESCHADDLISKPFNINELLSTIEHHLNDDKLSETLR